METILKLNKINKKYGNFYALKDVSINIKKGAIYGLIGQNGAGKTTLLRIITSLSFPNSGTYELFGIKNNDSNIQSIRSKTNAIVESPSLCENFTAFENLKQEMLLLGRDDFEIINSYLEKVGLLLDQTKKVKDFSLGMKQRLAIAKALLNNPKLLILDEPINGLDPKGILDMRNLLHKLNKEDNATIVISSHYLDELAKIATDYCFINNGTVIEEISNDNLLKKLKHYYLLEVNNKKIFIDYFTEKNIIYEILKDNLLKISADNNIYQIIIEIAKLKGVIFNLHEERETLEDYYLKIMGGDENA